MKLIIESKDYPHYENILTSPKKLKKLSTYGLVHTFDGTWELIPVASWYTRKMGDSLSRKHEYFPESGWFFYSHVRFLREENDFAPLTRFHNEEFSIVKDSFISIVLNCPIRQTLDSPAEVPREIRENMVQSIQDLKLEYPPYPLWGTSFPCATFGRSAAWHSSAGNILCAYNHDFAIELKISAWLHSREATPTEIAAISGVDILEESGHIAS